MLLAADPAQRRHQLVLHLAERYEAVTRRPAPDDPNEPIFLESLQATELQVLLEADLGVSVSMVDLAESPSLGGLAQMLDDALTEDRVGVGADLPVVVVDRAGWGEPFGLTDVQQAYWLGRSGLFELGDVSTHLYVQFESVDFDVVRADAVLRRLVDRHPMLRAVVRGDGRQQVLDGVVLGVEWEDLSSLSVEDAAVRVGVVRDRLSHEVRKADAFPLFGLVAQRLPGGVTRVHLSLDLLIADATSVQVFLSEWAALYADPAVELAPLELTFRDYVLSLGQVESGETYRRARDYWLGRVEDLPPAPELPVVGVSGPTRFVRREFRVEPGVWGALRDRAQSSGVTPSALLCAAYAQVLSVWARQPRFTVNVTVGDRLPVHPDVERVIGDFTGLVLLEVDAAGAGGFGQRVRRLQEQLWRDLEHRAFGGVRVLRELARVHGPARAAMPVVFTSVLGRPMPGGADGVVPGLGRFVEAVSQTPQVHVDCQVYEQGDALVVSWDAVEALFPAGLLDEAFAAYEGLLRRLVADPQAWESPGGLVPLPATVSEVYARANDVPGPVPSGLLHQVVADRALAQPQALAVVSSSGSLTYGELLRRARRVGRRLRAAGARPGELVAVCMDKGWEQVVAVLGVLESGAAYVPVDPGLPGPRREHLFEVTGVRVVLTQQAVAGRLSWPDGLSVFSVDDESQWADGDDAALPAVQSASDLAYVIFTSGSTGLPKGVMVDHRAALNTVLDVNRRWEVGPGDRVLAVSSLSFDLSVWDVFGMLAAGGVVVMPDPGTGRDPERWAQLVSRHRVTVWNSVPALFELFVEQVAQQGGSDAASLRLALLSGDWIPLSLPERAREVVGDLSVISLGGATEAAIWSIHHPVERVDPSWSSIPYGRPLTNQSFHVLDHDRQPRPVWVPGELYIGGVGVAQGYWRDPQRTAASFVVHPDTGERLYRTGDLGRYLPDGTIEFLGREDFQVKIGGFRIELGEIEATLAAHPDITAAVVTAHGDPRGNRRLVAYVVTDTATDLPVEDIRDWLRSRLPEYMVPATVIELDHLPLTSNGKINRTALPDPSTHRGGHEHVPPRTPTENALSTIWRNLLNLPKISINDNLFDLGADSLLALRATAAADNAGLHLTLRHIFQNPTIAQQATTTTPVGQTDLPVVVVDRAGWGEPFGLTDVQQAYWLGRSGLFELGDVSTHLYVQFESVDFDVVRADAVLRRLVDRHPMLRAVVRGDGRQQVLDGVVLGVEWEDLSSLSVEDAAVRVGVVRDRLSHEVRKADAFPLFGLVAQRLPGGVTRVHLSLDLLIADATSVQVFLSEWAALYADPAVELAPLELTFRDYVLSLGQVESGETYRRARDYWLGRVEDLPPAPELPVVGVSGPTRFVRREFRVEPGVWGALRDRAQSSGVTPSALLCAAYAQVLSVWARQPRFTVNVTVGDRLPVHPDVERVIGDFTGLVLLEVDAAGAGGFGQRVRRLQEQLWRDLEHRAFGGVRVLRELARVHGPARAAMPVVFTSVLGRPMPGGADGVVPGLGRFVEAVSQTPQVHVDCQVYEQGDALVVSWDAVEALFPAGLLDEAFAAYEGLLRRLVADPQAWESPGGLVPLPATVSEVYARANDVPGPVPSGLLHQVVADRALAQPQALAVVSSSGSLTYGELLRRARRVGRRLRAAGARPGELVAVCMDKGWEQVVAVLGVLESGAAYVPVDPGLPGPRREHLFEVTGVRVVLTQQAVAGRLSWPDGLSVFSVDDESQWADGDDAALPAVQSASDLAYVIFTSGSTGLPKGVMVDHRAALNTVLDVNRRWEVGPGDRVLAVSSLSFDLSVWDVFGMLAAGGVVVMPDPGTGRDPERWAQLVSRHRVTVWNSVPALFELFVEQVAQQGGSDAASLRLALLSGDWIPLSLPERAREVVGDLSVISLGGATEAAIWSIHHPVERVDPSWSSIPYGRPLTNQSFHVLDHDRQPRPVWVPGELYIGGVGVAQGYWRDPQRTAASFVVHPDTGERLYRTGDLGRYLPDGTIEFLGREDFQVKIGGFRIELGEIEATLAAHPDITAAVVTAHGDPRGNRRLVAYVVTDTATDLPVEDIRDWLRSRLPEYMVPATVIELDHLPLTSNGKINRTALPDPSTHRGGHEHVPPRTPTENALSTIWRNLLNLPKISINDNLFDLGADSLLALRATAAADNAGLHLTLRHIFQNPTIAQQATTTTPVGQTGPEEPIGRSDLTPSQQWFLAQDLPERHHWNDASFLLSLQRPLDLGLLRTALAKVIEHHDALRLRFSDSDGDWQAEVAPFDPAAELPFAVHDLAALGTADQKDAVIKISDGWQRSLDLRSGPLLRVAYFDMGPRPHCLLFLAHWLAVDHYSGRTVIEDLLACYAELEAGGAAALPRKTSPFRAWTRELRAFAQSAPVRAEIDYWTAPERRDVDSVRCDQTEGANDLTSLRTATVRVAHRTTESLVRLLARRTSVDFGEALTAAVLRALPVTGRDAQGDTRRVLMDLEWHGRDLPLGELNVSRTVGRFSTLAPVLVEMDVAAPVLSGVAEVSRQLRVVPAHGGHYGLLRYLGTDQDAEALAAMPQAEVGVNYLGQVDEVFLRSDLLSVPRMSYGQQRSDVGARVRLLDVVGYVVAGRLSLTVGYSVNRHTAETIGLFVDRLVSTLEEIAEQVR